MKAIIAISRPHQWIKNLIVFMPFIAAHHWENQAAVERLVLFFAAFCLTASAVYIYNDWIDLESDRRNPWKKRRPLAAGKMSVQAALIEAVALLLCAAALAWRCGNHAIEVLGSYVLLNLLYTQRLKRVAVLDVIVLASYYVLRVIGGGLVADVPISPWLGGGSLFFFMSVAIAKRYSELASIVERSAVVNTARGYRAGDLPLLAIVGVASGLISVLVLSLYINSDQVVRLYQRPLAIWGICPALLYWIVRVWLIAMRGELHEDPIVFAVRDKVSYGLLGGCALLLWVANPLFPS